MHRVWERYDSILYSLMCLSTIKGKVVDHTIEDVG